MSIYPRLLVTMLIMSFLLISNVVSAAETHPAAPTINPFQDDGEDEDEEEGGEIEDIPQGALALSDTALRAVILAAYPTNTIEELDLEMLPDGTLVFDVLLDSGEEIMVNAATGEILGTEVDDEDGDDDEDEDNEDECEDDEGDDSDDDDDDDGNDDDADSDDDDDNDDDGNDDDADSDDDDDGNDDDADSDDDDDDDDGNDDDADSDDDDDSECGEIEGIGEGALNLTDQQARESALAMNPGSTVVAVDLEFEDEGLVYSVELDSGVEVEIDASSGAVLETEESDTDDEDEDEDDDD